MFEFILNLFRTKPQYNALPCRGEWYKLDAHGDLVEIANKRAKA